VSLIADALKAAQQEKSRRIPSPAATGVGGYFAVRGKSRKSEGFPRPLAIGLAAAAGLGFVAALVWLLLSSVKPPVVPVSPPPVTDASAIAPPVAPAVSAAAPISLTDSASAVRAAPTAPPASIPTTTSAPTQIPAVATTNPAPATSHDSAVTTAPAPTGAAEVAPAPHPPSNPVRITMEEQNSVDSRPLFQQALAAQRRGDTNRAKELYARALENDPQNADLYNNIGMLYKSTGELDRAEDAYRHAVNLNPRLTAAWSNLGVLLDARGRRKEAIAALQQANAIDPLNVGVKVNLALQYHAAGLYSDARRLLEEAVRANPTMAEAQYALGRTLEAQGDRSSAIQHYDLFLKTDNGRFPALERQVTQHLAALRAAS
jgi:Tfp pilus assembly protein PilF